MRPAQAFCDALFAGAARGTATVLTAFLCDPYKAGRTQWRGIAWAPGKRVPDWFDKANAYVTVSTFQQHVATGDVRRRKADWVAMHAVMIDDIGTKVQRDKLLLPPTALIETSPENFQAYLFLRREDAARRDLSTCARLVDRMIKAGLTADAKDPGMKGVTRYGRLPCGINNKQKYIDQLGGQPHWVRMTEWAPERAYSVAEIATAYGLDMTPDAPRMPELPDAELTEGQVSMAVARFEQLVRTFARVGWYYQLNSAGWHEVECPWVEHHTGRATSGTALIPPSAENRWMGGFKCHHGHCEQKTMKDVWALVEATVDKCCAPWPWNES